MNSLFFSIGAALLVVLPASDTSASAMVQGEELVARADGSAAPQTEEDADVSSPSAGGRQVARRSDVMRRGNGPDMWALAIYGITALSILLLAVILLEWRAARTARMFADLWKSFADDRKQERDAYLRIITAQGRLSSEQRSVLDTYEQVGSDVVRNLERTKAEMAALLKRIQN